MYVCTDFSRRKVIPVKIFCVANSHFKDLTFTQSIVVLFVCDWFTESTQALDPKSAKIDI